MYEHLQYNTNIVMYIDLSLVVSQILFVHVQYICPYVCMYIYNTCVHMYIYNIQYIHT